ncbi:GNAT family N-acetyltransferase [bacterium (Candidatus Blackallbacteria) CG17_big_fil_post_rev_8_21_14_2_50_48_46]|uniref:GNAT family N-acetyltransferase n=1 Tax=bacterium (Candidatus Blackallbacteria) CG17_big_fil_post_rev_8_21_14_2_50_48_46 TaxID=2014261 RepID=A0A2M7G4D6_9BACT|nr:MAG: GNAT family N-acetyltransferase [bacterium (Candidatus Blackallbacteria) CG18_big_fil_WC_8_21_14_2_50_49_26]PIW16729.1 MAG: GNAT family N-acetyltransferase [bacterium (Candidatus Blackallbacteria) CG17_big_fil_post_rev_8_21_14_2_50_48_46]PIW46235.1 MAG: GNAT family N-acetyltransferase [bacterium (Candidatus Blackallbacteria) CG13_big_fil_rev_8_21_14_2_50_49_14]
MTLTIRLEEKKDYSEIERLTRSAFWNLNEPGCNEHYLLHLLREATCFVPELDFVACLEQRLVGNIVYTQAKIQKDDQRELDVLCFGPVSVHPDFQRQGIGRALIAHSQKVARELGFQAILIYGDPAYYVRLGFVPAEQYGIATADHHYADALQAFELQAGALQNAQGRFIEDSIYDIDSKQAELFDLAFEAKAKQTGLPSQMRFLEIVKRRKPRAV